MRPDSRFSSVMAGIGDMIVLNLLFILTCLPVFTIGASMCAMYGTVKKRLKGHESYIIRDYFSLWKENFRSASIQWLILLPCLAVMVFFTRFIAHHLQNLPLLCLYVLCFFLLSCVLLYVFPLQTTFANKPLKILANSLPTALSGLPFTILLMFIVSVPLCITLALPSRLPLTIPYWLVCGFSVQTIMSVLLAGHVLKKYEPEADEDENI